MFDLTFAIILCAYNIQCIIYYIEWAKAISINLLLLLFRCAHVFGTYIYPVDPETLNPFKQLIAFYWFT